MRENIKVRKWGRIILAFLATCFLVIFVWIAIDCFTSKKNATSKVITYQMKDSIDYEISLKDNQFYTSDEANEQNLYVGALLDTMQVNFTYELSGNKYFSSDYYYSVDLTMTSQNDKDTIWTYSENILPTVSNLSEGVMEIAIQDSVNIDLASLYAKALEFYELTDCDVDLMIEVSIHSNLTVSGYDDGIVDEQVLSLNIPISDKIISINKSIDGNVSKKILEQYEIDEEFNTYLFILSILFILALLPITIMSYIAIFNLVNLDDYDGKLKRLKKKYNYLIKEVHLLPNFKNKEIIELDSCRSLANICSEKDLNIYLYEHVKGKECLFYVIDKKEVYIYTLGLDYGQIDMKDKSKVIIPKKKS